MLGQYKEQSLTGKHQCQALPGIQWCSAEKQHQVAAQCRAGVKDAKHNFALRENEQVIAQDARSNEGETQHCVGNHVRNAC